MQNQEPNKVPQEIQNLLGKSYTFQIKVDDYNVKEGWEVYTVTSVFKSESNKHSRNVVADNIQIKQLETLFNHDQTIANDPIGTSDIKLLTSLKDVIDDNIIDDVFGNTQLVRRQKLIINCLIITFLSHNVFFFFFFVTLIRILNIYAQ